MNYRRAVILPETAKSTAGTHTENIELTDPISRLVMRFRATNGADRCVQAAHPAALISKIELVDGSDVLFSLGGHEAQALNAYEEGETPDTEIIDGNDDNQHCTFHINFGRFLWDPLLAFDPNRFKNPQLKITHNYQAVDSGAVAGYLLIHADVFDEKQVVPLGFLMSKEIEDLTLAGTAFKYTDIPTDHPIRKLLLRAYLTNSALNSQLDEVKLSEDNDKKIPLDVDMDQYLRDMMSVWTPLQEHWQIRGQTTTTAWYAMPTYWPVFYGMSQYSEDWWRDSTYYQAERQAIAADAAMSGPAMGVCYGYVPHHVVEFPMGLQNEIEDWYDVTKLGSLKARLKGLSGSTAVCTWFAQQLRRY